jgi:hypothetical protein
MLHDIPQDAFDQALQRMNPDANGATGIGNVGMAMVNGVLTPTLAGAPPLASVTLDGAVFAYGEGEPIRDDRKYLYTRADVERYVAMQGQKQRGTIIIEDSALQRAPTAPPAQAEPLDPDQMARDRSSLMATFSSPDGSAVRAV